MIKSIRITDKPTLDKVQGFMMDNKIDKATFKSSKMVADKFGILMFIAYFTIKDILKVEAIKQSQEVKK